MSFNKKNVYQVTRLLALIYGRFEAICHKTRCKCQFKKPLVKWRKVIAPEVCKLAPL
jgi:hypothetical protein